MASQPPSSLKLNGAKLMPVVPQHFVPPTARELRAQSVQRLQVGLFGLAGMLLMVGLANIINDRVRLSDQAAGVQPAPVTAASGEPKSDPLADIGVVPSAAAGTAAPQATAAAAAKRN